MGQNQFGRKYNDGMADPPRTACRNRPVGQLSSFGPKMMTPKFAQHVRRAVFIMMRAEKKTLRLLPNLSHPTVLGKRAIYTVRAKDQLMDRPPNYLCILHERVISRSC